MSERREFFEVTIDFSQLEIHARCSDSTLRWASAIELGQLGTEEAISLLWSLTTDLDINVRDAAKLSLDQCDEHLVGKVLATKWTADITSDSGLSVEGVAKHTPWKIRPLDVPSKENEWAVDAAVLNIIQTEGPLTGSRLLRLYGNATYPDSPMRLPKKRIQKAVERLEKRGVITYVQNYAEGELESWTLFQTKTPAVIVREQGSRKLSEIPVTEVIARLKVSMDGEFEFASQNERFQFLVKEYSIKQSELDKIGDILAKEWSSLLTI